MGVTGIALVLNMLFATTIQVRLAQYSMVENIVTIADTIVDLSPDVFSVLRKESADKLLDVLKAEPDIEIAIIYNTENVGFSSYLNPKNASQAVLPNQVGPDGNEFVFQQKTIKLKLFHPILVDGQRIGTLYILAGINKIYGHFLQFFISLFLSLFVILIITIFISSRFQRVFTEPISELAIIARNVSQKGDYSVRVQSHSNDEIGRLVVDFNNMLEAIQIRDEELSDHRHNLEALVRERTEELREKRDEALAAANAKSEFLANMSHEIRTPMNGVIGVLSLLKDAPLKEDHRRLLETASRSADSLMMIIDDILDFSKIDAGMIEFESVEFNLRQLMEEVALLFIDSIDPDRTDLVCFMPTDVDDHVVGDPTRLRQILSNLVSNAIKFTEHGEVVLRVLIEKRKGEELFLKFLVQDTGIGIPEGSLNTLFDKFTQADGSTTRKYGGTGLGLSVCKQLVEQQGGEIGVESKDGEGACFWFVLPLTTCDFNSPEPVTAQDFSHKRCIIVDDNATNRMLLVHYLENSGIQISTCASGEDMLDVMRNLSIKGDLPDLVLLDYHMPNMNGLELAAVIKKSYGINTPRLVMLSSGNLPVKIVRDAGIHDLICKPVRRNQFLKVLNGQRALETAFSDDETTLSSVERNLEHEESLLSGRILLVDDEPINQKVALAILNKYGLGADLAVDGGEAVQMVKKETYDLVLMDIQMPGMSGYEATKIIRQWEAGTSKKRVPIVAMTANAMESARNKCLEIGMDDFITKPIKPDMLFKRLMPWLGKSYESATGNNTLMASNYDEAIWNKGDALDLVGGDESLLKDMANVFLKRVDKLLGNIHSAIEGKQSLGLDDSAHAYKGAVSHFSAHRVKTLAEKLEKKGEIGDFRNTEELLKELREESNTLCTALHSFCLDSSG